MNRSIFFVAVVLLAVLGVGTVAAAHVGVAWSSFPDSNVEAGDTIQVEADVNTNEETRVRLKGDKTFFDDVYLEKTVNSDGTVSLSTSVEELGLDPGESVELYLQVEEVNSPIWRGSHTDRTSSWEVERPKNIDAEIRSFNVPTNIETHDQPNEVGAIVAVENTGNVEKDFFLGYSVYDESGTSYDNSEQTGQSISLAPGEVEYYYQSDIHWTVEDSAPTGSYDAETSVWAESDRDNLQTRLDRERINDAFEVRAPELSVTPQTEDVGNVPRDDPERVRYEVNNEGVGDLNWDIISGSFAVVDRGGDWFEVEYTQAGEFDTDITVLALNDHLEGDSTQTVEYRGYGTVEPGDPEARGVSPSGATLYVGNSIEFVASADTGSDGLPDEAGDPGDLQFEWQRDGTLEDVVSGSADSGVPDASVAYEIPFETTGTHDIETTVEDTQTGLSDSFDRVSVDVRPVTISGTVTDAEFGEPISSAVISVDGTEVATTNSAGEYSATIDNLDAAETHEVTIKPPQYAEDGYETETTSATFADGEAVIDSSLTATPKDVRIVVSDAAEIEGYEVDGELIEDATVEIAGETYHTDEEGAVDLTLPAGTYEYTVTADGFETLNGEMEIRDGTGLRRQSVQLVRDGVGALTIDVVDMDRNSISPINYDLYANNNKLEPNAQGQVLLEAGEYTLTAEGEPKEYTSESREIEIVEGRTTEQTISLSEKVSLTVDSEDGGQTEVTPPGETTTQGTYTYKTGTEVDITARPNADSEFAGWSTDNPTIPENEQTVTFSLESDTDLTATFTEAETLPPIEDLQIEVLRINGEEPDNGVIEYGEIESAVVSVELRITGPNGGSISADSLNLKVADGFQSDPIALERVEGDRFQAGYDISNDIVTDGKTAILDIEVSHPEVPETQTKEVETVFVGDDLQRPIDGWVPTGGSHEVVVEGETYAALEMRDSDSLVNSWLVLNQDGTIVTDSEIYEKASLTAHVSDINARSGSARQEEFENISAEYDKLLLNIERSEQILFVRDKLAEYIGVAVRVKSGGATEVKAEIIEQATDDIVEKFLTEAIVKAVGALTNDQGQVITQGLLEEDPIGSMEAMIAEHSETEIKEASESAEKAATILEEHDESEPWTHEEASEYWEAEQSMVVDGSLYTNVRVNMLPDADALSQLEDVTVAAADGATGDSANIQQVHAMVSLVREGELGYVSDAMEETAELRAQRVQTEEEFTTEAVNVRETAVGEHGETAVLLEESAVSKNLEAGIQITEEPSGTYVKGEEVNTTVEITNYGDKTRQFFAGYSTIAEVDGETQFYDNGGQTGDFIAVAPGETREKTVTWEVQSTAPTADDYGVIVAVWSEFPEASDTERLDHEQRSNVFEVVDRSNIQLSAVDVSEQTVAVGERVQVNAAYHNDGVEPGTEISELTLDGELVNRRLLDVEPGSVSTTHRMSFEEPGRYELAVDGEYPTEVTVIEPNLETVGTTVSTESDSAPATVAATVEVANPEEIEVTETLDLTINGEVVDWNRTTVEPNTNKNIQLSHTFDQPGEYEVKVGDTVKTVVIEDSDDPTPPEADAGGPYTVDEDDTVSLDASGSTAPDGEITQTEWEVIDGPGSITDGNYQAPSGLSENVTVQLTVTTSNSQSDTDTGTVTIQADSESDDPSIDPVLSGLSIAGNGDTATITEGENEPIEVAVENPGDTQETFTTELALNETQTATETVTVDAGGVETVTLTDVTSDLAAANYDVVVQVTEGTAQLSGDLTVTEPDDTQPTEGIAHADNFAGTTYTTEDPYSAEVLVATPANNQTLTIGGTTGRTIEIRHPATDRRLEVTPENETELTSETFWLNLYSADGTLREDPSVDLENDQTAPVELTGDEDIFTDFDGPFTQFSLALLEEGTVVDTTEPRRIGIGYPSSFEQSGTQGNITITLPRDTNVDEDWAAEFKLGAIADGGPLATSDVTHTDQDESFEVSVNVSDVEPGVYSGRITLYNDTAASPDADRVIAIVGYESIAVGEPDEIAPKTDISADSAGNTESPIRIGVFVEQRVPESAILTVRDPDGSVVFTEDVTEAFQNQRTVSRRIGWDPVDQDGTPLPDGEYTAVFTATDEFGNEVVTNETITVDNTRPEINNVGVGSAPVTNSEEDIIVGADITSSPSNLSAVQLGVDALFTEYSNTTSFQGGEIEQASEDDRIEVTIDPATLAADIGDGNFTVTAFAADAAGNTAVVANDTVAVDTSVAGGQSRVSDLGSDTATLAIAAGEDVTVNSVDVVAEAADGTTADRTPPAQAIPDSADDEFDIPFNGTTVAGQDTTFTVITEIEDAAGNTETLSLNSSITGYEVTEGEAVVDPDGTDAEFALSTTAAVNNASRNATIAQTPTSTAGTAVDADQVASTFIDVTDIGLSETELESATVRVPAEAVDLDGVDTADLVYFYSPDGTEEYHVLEPGLDDGELIVEVDGFSQLALGTVDDQPPEVSISSETAESAPTVEVAYDDDLSEINVSSISLRVNGDLVTADDGLQVTGSMATYELPGESESPHTVSVEVADAAGNAVQEETTLQDEESSSSDGTGGAGDDGSDGAGDDGSDGTGGAGDDGSGGTGDDGSDGTGDDGTGGTGGGTGGAGGGTGGAGGGTGAQPRQPEPVETELVDVDDGVTARIGSVPSGETVEIETAEMTTGDRVALTKLEINHRSEASDYRVEISNVGDSPPENAPAVDTGSVVGYLDVSPIGADSIDGGELSFAVADSELPAGASTDDVVMYHYDDGWETLETQHASSSGGVHEFTAITDGFSPFAIGVQMGDISVTDATVTAETITPGETTAITATVTNDGPMEDSTTLTLDIEGEATIDQQLVVDAGETAETTFEPTIEQPGEYTVRVNGVTAGTVSVEQANEEQEEAGEQTEQDESSAAESNDGSTTDDVPGFGVLAALVAILVATLIARRS